MIDERCCTMLLLLLLLVWVLLSLGLLMGLRLRVKHGCERGRGA